MRRRWSSPGEGSDHPLDRLLDAAEATVSVGVRKLCCELGIDARSFARSVERLKSTAQLTMGEELFRQIVEQEGKAALAMSAKEELEVGWSASECKTTTPSGDETSRLYASGDGVMVPTITQGEKDKRRAKTLERRERMPRAQRRRLGRLAAVKKGTDQRYKQVYVTSFYDQSQTHRLVGVTAKGAAGGNAIGIRPLPAVTHGRPEKRARPLFGRTRPRGLLCASTGFILSRHVTQGSRHTSRPMHRT